MHKSDKAPEPSMEEILASIRKIIAEEPIGSRPGPESAMPGGGETSPTAHPSQHRDNDGPDGPPYSVEDALADLMDDRPQRRSARAADQEPAHKPREAPGSMGPTEGEARGSSWLCGRATSMSPAQPQPRRPHSVGRVPASTLREQLGSIL